MELQVTFLLLIAAPMVLSIPANLQPEDLAAVRSFEKALNGHKPSFKVLNDFKDQALENTKEMIPLLRRVLRQMDDFNPKEIRDELFLNPDFLNITKSIKDGLDFLWQGVKDVSDFHSDFETIITRMMDNQPMFFRLVDSYEKEVREMVNNQKTTSKLLNQLFGKSRGFNQLLEDVDSKVKDLIESTNSKLDVMLQINNILGVNEAILERVQELFKKNQEIMDMLDTVKMSQDQISSSISSIYLSHSKLEFAYNEQTKTIHTHQLQYVEMFREGKQDVLEQVSSLEQFYESQQIKMQQLLSRSSFVIVDLSDIDASVNSFRGLINRLVERFTIDLDQNTFLVVKGRFDMMITSLQDMADSQQDVITILTTNLNTLDNSVDFIIDRQRELRRLLNQLGLDESVLTDLNAVNTTVLEIAKLFDDLESDIVARILAIKRRQDRFVLVVREKGDDLFKQCTLLDRSQSRMERKLENLVDEVMEEFDHVQGNASVAFDEASSLERMLANAVDDLFKGHEDIKLRYSRNIRTSLRLVDRVENSTKTYGQNLNGAWNSIGHELGDYLNGKDEVAGQINRTCKTFLNKVEAVLKSQISLRGKIQDVGNRGERAIMEAGDFRNNSMSGIFAAQDMALKLRGSIKEARCTNDRALNKVKGDFKMSIAELRQSFGDVDDVIGQHVTAYNSFESMVGHLGDRVANYQDVSQQYVQARNMIRRLSNRLNQMGSQLDNYHTRLDQVEQCHVPRFCPSS